MLSLFITETARREQSRHKFFNRIYIECKKKQIKFKIIAFLESEKEPMLSDVDVITPIESIGVDFLKRSSLLKFWNTISKYKPDHLFIGGYGYAECWLGLFYAKKRGIPVTFWSGAGNDTTINKSIFYDVIKRVFVRNVDNAITYGSNATKFLKKLGMRSSLIFQCVNVSDVDYFRKILAGHLNSEEMLTNVINKEKPILVFAGRLEKEKGVHLLVEQLKLLPLERYFCYFIGKGSLKKYIQSTIKNNEINGTVCGFLPQREVAKKFVESDIYILPSLNDPFSRTLSEALAAGCFCLNSKYDDASYDLINEGKNGYIFDPMNPDQFQFYLEMVTSDDWKRPNRIEISESFEFNMISYSEKVVEAVSVLLVKK